MYIIHQNSTVCSQCLRHAFYTPSQSQYLPLTEVSKPNCRALPCWIQSSLSRAQHFAVSPQYTRMYGVSFQMDWLTAEWLLAQKEITLQHRNGTATRIFHSTSDFTTAFLRNTLCVTGFPSERNKNVYEPQTIVYSSLASNWCLHSWRLLVLRTVDSQQKLLC